MMMIGKLLKKTFISEPQPDVICGKTCYDLPVKNIEPLSNRLISAHTGPGPGLVSVGTSNRSKAFQVPQDLATDVAFIDEDDENEDGYSSSSTNNNSPEPAITSNKHDTNCSSKGNGTMSGKGNDVWNNLLKRESSSPKLSKFSFTKGRSDSFPEIKSFSPPNSISTTPSNTSLQEEIAGVNNWNCPTENAYGLSVSLYESHPITSQRAGEPIADAFGICVRENSVILALADGVNWGEGACIAARSAIHGSIDYLNKALYHEGGEKVTNTMDLFVCLLRSFSAAHNMILHENGRLTTLTVVIIAQLKNSDKFAVCSCNVGDSFAYVYSKRHGVREITQGSHDIFSMRDMRSALGALGPVDGTNPELYNLTVAMTLVEQGDIVFLASDGISDNFDPVVGKFALPKKSDSNRTHNNTNVDCKKNSEQANNKANGSSSNVTSESVATKNKINSKLFCSRSNSVKLPSSSGTTTKNPSIAATAKSTTKTISSNHRSRPKSEGQITQSLSSEDIKSSSSNKSKKSLSSRSGHSKKSNDHDHHHSSNNNHHRDHLKDQLKDRHKDYSKDQHNNNTSSTKKSISNIMSTTKSDSKDNKSLSKLKRCESLNDKNSSTLPVVTAFQRHEFSLLRMEDLIRYGFNQTDKHACTTAKELCEIMIDWATKLTSAKRRILEDPDLYDTDTSWDYTQQRTRRRAVVDKLVMLPGKLDHATIVACKVAFYGDYVDKSYKSDGDSNRYNLKLKATLAKFESHDDF